MQPSFTVQMSVRVISLLRNLSSANNINRNPSGKPQSRNISATINQSNLRWHTSRRQLGHATTGIGIRSASLSALIPSHLTYFLFTCTSSSYSLSRHHICTQLVSSCHSGIQPGRLSWFSLRQCTRNLD